MWGELGPEGDAPTGQRTHISVAFQKRQPSPFFQLGHIIFANGLFKGPSHLFIQGTQRKGTTSLLLSFSSLAKHLGTKVELWEAVCLRPRTRFTDNRTNSLMGPYLFQIVGNGNYDFLSLNPNKYWPFPPAPSYRRSSTSRCPYQILINKSLSYTIGLKETWSWVVVSWAHRRSLSATVVCWKNWDAGGQRKKGGRRFGVGVGESWAKTLSQRSRSPGCCLEFQNGGKDLGCFHMEIGLGADFVSGWNWSQDQVQWT